MRTVASSGSQGHSIGQLNWSPTPGAWSIGHCLQHLLIGNEIYLPARLSVGSAAGSSATTSRLHRLLLRRPKRSGPLELWNAQLLTPSFEAMRRHANWSCGLPRKSRATPNNQQRTTIYATRRTRERLPHTLCTAFVSSMLFHKGSPG